MTDYGLDLTQPNGDVLSGLPEQSGRVLIIHDLVRMLTMNENHLGKHLPEGYPWDETYEGRGFNLDNLVNSKMRDHRTVARSIEAECIKDDRVESASVTVDKRAGNVLLITIGIVDEIGEFPFTIQVSDLTIETLYQGRSI